MNRTLIFLLVVLAAGGVLWLMWAPRVPEPEPRVAPTTPARTVEAPEREPTDDEALLEGEPAPGDEFVIEIPPSEVPSPEGLYRDLRDAVRSIQRTEEVEREGPVLPGLPPLPEPTLPDPDDDEDPPLR